MALTPSQAAAVDYAKNLILFAGPGSGKTSTSVAKGVRILSVPANRLCMVTFTTAAAEEMRARMAARFDKIGVAQPGKRLMCGTFHALTLRHYQQHAKQTTRLIAPPARSGMVQAMLSNVDPSERKDYQLALERYQGALDQHAVEFENEDHYSFVMDYYKRLANTNSVDLAMTMRECVTLMRSGDIPLFPVTHLLGDEIQDADEIQLELVLAHARAGVICTLVGDDDQCIYEWRSALGYQGMVTFARETGAKTIALGENFRSREEVVFHAKELIAYNDPNRIEKNQVSTRGPGGELGQEGFASIVEQCQHVVRYIELRRAEGESVAVLARTNASLSIMGCALHKSEIPYVQDSDTLWDLPPVAVLLSTLSGLVNASTTSLHPVLSILTISAKTRRSLERQLGDKATLLLGGIVPTLEGATDQEVKLLQKMATAFSIWREQLQVGEVDLVIPQVVDCVLNWYQAHLSASKTPEVTVRNQMKRIRSSYEDAETILLKLKGTLSKRLNTVTLLNGKDHGPEAVQLKTMHASKGLEFDTVFLLEAFEPDDGSLIVAEEAERRLFFVAMTRARERFFALYSDTPSPFIAEAQLPPIARATVPQPT